MSVRGTLAASGATTWLHRQRCDIVGRSVGGLRSTAHGTYSAISVTATAHYYDCDSPPNASCDLAATVSPK